MINRAAIPTVIAIAIQLFLGYAVFQANTRRKSNQTFLLLSVSIATWLACISLGLSANSTTRVSFYIRQASASAVLILVFANFLRLSIRQQERTWHSMIRESRAWLVSSLAAIIFCQTKWFVTTVRFSQDADTATSLPSPVYGEGAGLYACYFAIAGLCIIISYARDARKATGIRRAEFSFILIGAVATLGSVFVVFVLGFFFDRSRLVWFAPFRILLLSLIVAYGITTRKIMDVGLFLRRTISYLLLAVYLLAVYAIVWWLVSTALLPIFPNERTSAAHVLAALTIAFAMVPARGFSQSLADKLLTTTRGLDFRVTVQKAAVILQSVTVLPDLLEKFVATIAEALDTGNVGVYLLTKKDDLAKAHALVDTTGCFPDRLSLSDPIVQRVNTDREPLIFDELIRGRATPLSRRLSANLRELNIAAALGIFSRDNLVGIMLLGERHSGRIYGATEQGALQVLCGQLAAAIENAELFTEVQNAKIYNETLLRNLTTGVIAVDSGGHITVFNSEAGQITGLTAERALHATADELPAPLGDIIQLTLSSGVRQEDREVYLRSSSGNVFTRASTSIFHDQTGGPLGALMVVTDITALKRLELQIRRSDRLASLGTLSAGMAHEIKNPLVSIKTFTQLLPERYDDSEFRDTFSSLISHEIDRIDSLVNQLLRFARPAKPLLRPTQVHEILEKSLLLVRHRLYQREIKLAKQWGAQSDTIHGDADQLEQVFLNFFLNAMDAMKRGGELTVKTSLRKGDILGQDFENGSEEAEALSICIGDTGDGIKPEDIPHVFDPFFTTKDYGTGLGLSVVHGIIQEHGGQIEVESELGKGTLFHIFLPVVHFDAEVVAAV